MRSARDQRAAVRFVSFLRLVWVCEIDEIELSNMGKNNENHDLVCEKTEIYQEY